MSEQTSKAVAVETSDIPARRPRFLIRRLHGPARTSGTRRHNHAAAAGSACRLYRGIDPHLVEAGNELGRAPLRLE
jgi:hypothetical protein